MADDLARPPPTWIVARAAERLFRELPPTNAWAEGVREASSQGTVVHVLRNESLLDLLALDYLARRHGLAPLGFANALEGWVKPSALASRRSPVERLRATLASGEAAVLFMKRPPTVLARATASHRGRSEGDELLRALVDEERRGARVVLMPHTFVWTKRPERLGFSLVDTLFGPAEFPGELRALAQVALNHKHSVLRAGEPLAIGEILAAERDADDDVLARRLTYALLRRLERERRAVLGPVQKPVDRVREEVLRSPKLQAAIRDLAGTDGDAKRALEDKARGMLREMETTPDVEVQRGLEAVAETLVDRVYAGIDVDAEGLARVREAAKKGSIVLLPSHKSHVDYVLLSFVLRKNGLMIPVVAAGDNLDFFPVGPIFRKAGAFFIRRSFKGDRLYMAVVDAYVRRLLRDGHAIEFFLEGGRSRTGKLLPPQLGLLNMVVDAALAIENRTISFVPISIGYERMMEDGAYARELSGGAKRKEDAAALLALGEVLRDTYGRANVQVGKIVELAELREKAGIGAAHDAKIPPAKRRALVTRLARLVMSEINRVTAVTPGALVATALLGHGSRGMPHAHLVEQTRRLVRLVRGLGARTSPSLVRASGELREASIREAAQLFVRGGLIREHVPGDTLTGTAKRRAKIYTGDDVIYTVPDDKRLSLDISKNIILHLFVDRALVAVALLAEGASRPASRASIAERVQSLSRLFKLEFAFRADAPFEQIFDETLAAMIDGGELARTPEGIGFGAGRDGLDGRGWIAFYARLVRNFLEGYRVAARATRLLLKGPTSEKELVAKALGIGEQMFLGGEIERSEAVSRLLLENAFTAFLEQGYLRREKTELALSDSFASEETARAIESKITGFLDPPTA